LKAGYPVAGFPHYIRNEFAGHRIESDHAEWIGDMDRKRLDRKK
jgi:hypothetical protein